MLLRYVSWFCPPPPPRVLLFVSLFFCLGLTASTTAVSRSPGGHAGDAKHVPVSVRRTLDEGCRWSGQRSLTGLSYGRNRERLMATPG